MNTSMRIAFIGAARARNVARELNRRGYETATPFNCRGYICNIAANFEPGDPQARLELEQLIWETVECGEDQTKQAGVKPLGGARLILDICDSEVDKIRGVGLSFFED